MRRIRSSMDYLLHRISYERKKKDLHKNLSEHCISLFVRKDRCHLVCDIPRRKTLTNVECVTWKNKNNNEATIK